MSVCGFSASCTHPVAGTARNTTRRCAKTLTVVRVSTLDKREENRREKWHLEISYARGVSIPLSKTPLQL